MVASPDYLKDHERPAKPADLAKHRTLAYAFATAQTRWFLKSKSESASVTVIPRVTSDQMTSLLSMAVQGGGIAFIPSYLCRARTEHRRLGPRAAAVERARTARLLGLTTGSKWLRTLKTDFRPSGRRS